MNTPSGPDSAPQVRILTQYVKELSFRNPMAAFAASSHNVQPSIDMGVEVNSRPMEQDSSAWEVDLRINVGAKRGEDTLFMVDLIYSGIFQFHNIAAADLEPLLWVECPRLLFPFSRQILAEMTREGGYPPLLINPIDFTPLYASELREREQRGASAPAF